jgi:hypothetical protein
MEKNRGNELIQAIIHIYMEMSQRNTLYSYLKQTKMPFFQKTQTRKIKQALPGGWYQWEDGGYKERV